jgi:hypothetical protein
VKAQRPGGLRDRQALAIMAVVDLGECLVIDHEKLGRVRSWPEIIADLGSLTETEVEQESERLRHVPPQARHSRRRVAPPPALALHFWGKC